MKYFLVFKVFFLEQSQNSTLEERVELLEIQVVVIQDELMDLDEDVDFLFDGQIIQDERLLNLEETSTGILGELNVIDEAIEGEKFGVICQGKEPKCSEKA